MVHFISFLSTMTPRAWDSNLEGGGSKNNLIAPAIFFFLQSSKTFQSKLWLGWNCWASSAGRKSWLITSSLMLRLIRIVPPAGTAHMATLLSERARGMICSEVKTAHREYLDCAVQIFVAPWHSCHHPELARQRLPVIHLIISNCPTGCVYAV